MRDLKKMCDRELFREAWQRGLAYWRVSQLRGTACFPDYNVHNSVAEPLAVVANEAREAVIKRMKSRVQSHPWDGTGPKRDCLFLIRLGLVEPVERWVQFEWRDEDEGCHQGYYEYVEDLQAALDSDPYSSTYGRHVESHGFAILRWSDLPEVDDSEAAS